LSPPVLTRTVKRVENLVGVKLFSRTTRQVALAPAGREFATLARRLLNDLKLGVDSVRKLEGGARPGAGEQCCPATDAALAAEFAHHGRSHLGVEIHLRQGLHSQIMEDVRAGAVDFSIGYLDDLPRP
jgi:DNA-binding transcriptional LysR family regulator